MRTRFIGVLIVFLVAVSGTSGQTPVSLSVQVFDLQKNPLHATARLKIQGIPEKVLAEIGTVLQTQFDRGAACGGQSVPVLGLDVGAPGDLFGRMIPLYSTVVCMKGNFTYEIYLAKKKDNVNFNVKYVLQTDEILQNIGVDAALAYLGPAIDDYYTKTPTEHSDYACYLKFYYATMNHRACVEKAYATCSNAEESYQELKQSYCQPILKKNNKFFPMAQADVLAKEAKVATFQGDYAGAIERWDKIGDIAKEVDLSSISLTADHINSQRGMAYAGLGLQLEAGSPDEATSAYKMARTSLDLVTNPTSAVKLSKERLIQKTGQ